MRRGWGIVAFAVLVVLGAPAMLFGPYWLRDRNLDRIVVAVALDWRDFGDLTARERLTYEVDRAGLAVYVDDDSCVFTLENGVRDVRCAWDEEVLVPLTKWSVPLSFSSHARILADGRLR